MSEVEKDLLKKEACGYKTSVLADFADGGLSHSRRMAVQRHVAGCSACRDALASIASAKNATELLRDELSHAQPSSDGFAAMMARVRQEQEHITRKVSRPLFSRLPAWSAAVAAMLAIALMIPVLFNNSARKSFSSESSSEGAITDMAGAPASTSPAFVDKGNNEVTSASQDGQQLLNKANAGLDLAGIMGEPIYSEKEGTAVLAIWFSSDADLAAARAILADTVKASFIPCENTPVIEIIEGETPIDSADSPENRRIQEALGFLPQVEASRSDDPGRWLILTWRVEN